MWVFPSIGEWFFCALVLQKPLETVIFASVICFI